MGKLTSFQFLTLNGYFQGPDNDISWHPHDADGNELATEGLQSDGILLFGRTTYEMMAGFWPTPAALDAMPAVAEGMNKAEKIVVSRHLPSATWHNTRIIRDHLEAAIRQLKKESTKDITILGSGSILAQLAGWGLVDTFQFQIDPMVLGDGSTILQGLSHPLPLQLTAHRVFRNGGVLLTYEPREK